MVLKAEDPTIFSSFKSATKKDWINVATKELNGADPLEKLSFSLDSLKFHPYYDQSNKIENFSFSLASDKNPYLGARAWTNAPKIKISEALTANKNALESLNNGADGILFEVATGFTDFQKVLKNIDLKFCSVSFLLSTESIDQLNELKKYFDSQPEGISVSLFHPSLDFLSGLESWKGKQPFGIITPASDPTHELVHSFSRILTMADKLTDKGWLPIDAFKSLSVLIEIETNFFYAIAKLKAMQMIWQKILTAYEIKEEFKLPVHALIKTSSKNSMLKNTTGALAAILGGCSALTVEPEDYNNPRMVRIARNVSNILREESHLSKVADPTAGAYYIDSLTYSFAKAAWEKIIEL